MISGTCLNYLIGIGSIIQLFGVIIAVIPLRGEQETSAVCNVNGFKRTSLHLWFVLLLVAHDGVKSQTPRYLLLQLSYYCSW